MNAPVRPIHIGDFSPTVRLLNQRGRKVWAFDTNLAGRPVVYLLLRDATSQAAGAALESLRDRYTEFQEIGAQVVAISNLQPDGNSQLIQDSDLPFSVLSDTTGHYASSFGSADSSVTVACAVVDINCRLLKLLDDLPAASLAEQSLKLCRKEVSASGQEQIITQAPVLLVPRIFEPEFCKQMIKYWRQGDKEVDQITRRADGAHLELGNDQMKRRTDVLAPEGNHPVNLQIRQRLSMRVMPELEKAFNHKASRYELARVGCYESAKKGFFKAHRDLYPGDTETPRRFAMSLNLNDGFGGGSVRFPEYGMQTYRPPLGGGLIFSCRLLHEALPVTKGKRFALFLFFN